MARQRIDAYTAYCRVSLDLDEEDSRKLRYLCKQKTVGQQIFLRKAIRDAYSQLSDDEYRIALQERKQQEEERDDKRSG